MKYPINQIYFKIGVRPWIKIVLGSSGIWSLLGQSIHTILERANRTAITERRLSMAEPPEKFPFCLCTPGTFSSQNGSHPNSSRAIFVLSIPLIPFLFKGYRNSHMIHGFCYSVIYFLFLYSLFTTKTCTGCFRIIYSGAPQKFPYCRCKK